MAISKQQCIHTLYGHTSSVISVKLSQNGKFIVSGSYDNTIHVWSLQNLKNIRTLIKHTKYAWTVAISSSCNIIVSGSWDHSVIQWNMVTGCITRMFLEHNN